jgi:SAM-dependent methyltransferase
MKLKLLRLARQLKNRVLGVELRGFRRFHSAFAGKVGLEVGGPSKIFTREDLLPVYPLAARVDGVNFAESTVWEGRVTEGMSYRYEEGKTGRQFVGEGGALDRIADATYDFVLSSHSLEHSANALRAVSEWKRVLKPGGAMLVIVPDRRHTFDHRRPVTRFEHLLADFDANVGEDDMTHLEEILALHDLARDPLAGSPEQFRERSLKNFENRCFHQHVFDARLLRRVFAHFDLVQRYEDSARPFHIIILGTKR